MVRRKNQPKYQLEAIGLIAAIGDDWREILTPREEIFLRYIKDGKSFDEMAAPVNEAGLWFTFDDVSPLQLKNKYFYLRKKIRTPGWLETRRRQLREYEEYRQQEERAEANPSERPVDQHTFPYLYYQLQKKGFATVRDVVEAPESRLRAALSKPGLKSLLRHLANMGLSRPWSEQSRRPFLGNKEALTIIETWQSGLLTGSSM